MDVQSKTRNGAWPVIQTLTRVGTETAPLSRRRPKNSTLETPKTLCHSSRWLTLGLGHQYLMLQPENPLPMHKNLGRRLHFPLSISLPFRLKLTLKKNLYNTFELPEQGTSGRDHAQGLPKVTAMKPNHKAKETCVKVLLPPNSNATQCACGQSQPPSEQSNHKNVAKVNNYSKNV